MANKRILKKQINYACIDMGANCIVASALRSVVDETAINAVLDKIASLQTKTLKNINIAFDKAPRDFGSINEYKKERRQYFAKAYASLRENFNKEVEEIVKDMNAALPPLKKK